MPGETDGQEGWMTVDEFRANLRTENARWDALISQVPQERMAEPGVAGDGVWSVKDLIAHVTWYEREMVGVLRTHALVGSELWALPGEQRNLAIYEQIRQRPLAEVLAEAQQVAWELVEAVEAISEEDLNNPQAFPGMEPDWVPWQIIAGNSYGHKQEHSRQVRRWLDQTSNGGAEG